MKITWECEAKLLWKILYDKRRNRSLKTNINSQTKGRRRKKNWNKQTFAVEEFSGLLWHLPTKTISIWFVLRWSRFAFHHFALFIAISTSCRIEFVRFHISSFQAFERGFRDLDFSFSIQSIMSKTMKNHFHIENRIWPFNDVCLRIHTRKGVILSLRQVEWLLFHRKIRRQPNRNERTNENVIIGYAFCMLLSYTILQHIIPHWRYSFLLSFSNTVRHRHRVIVSNISLFCFEKSFCSASLSFFHFGISPILFSLHFIFFLFRLFNSPLVTLSSFPFKRVETFAQFSN